MNFYIESYGCSANTASSEIMEGLLERVGMIRVSSAENADIIIINTCIVKMPTEHHMIKRITEFYNLYPQKLIVAGCMPEAEPELVKRIAPKASMLGTHHIKEIVNGAKKILIGQRFELLGYANEIKLSLPRVRKNPAIAIVPISEGCLGNCSYCIVKFAKGKLFSYPIEEVLKEIEHSVKAGCKEIWITSQDNSAYGLDRQKKSQLPELLYKIGKLPGRFWARVGMMDPDGILPVIDDLVESFRSEKIFKFIHIPVQSGNNEILKKMRRRYTVENFKEIVKIFRKSIPKISLSTDIICGFPSETREQFMDSVNLIKEIKPDVLNISRFWAMPGTEALQMKEQIQGNETKERSKLLTEEFKKIALEKNIAELRTEQLVFIDEEKKVGGKIEYIGRTEFYRPVAVSSDNRDGRIFKKFVRVRIKDVTPHSLIGEIVKDY